MLTRVHQQGFQCIQFITSTQEKNINIHRSEQYRMVWSFYISTINPDLANRVLGIQQRLEIPPRSSISMVYRHVKVVHVLAAKEGIYC